MSKQQLPTFEVDKKGLAKLQARRGKGFVVTELIQNAWDERSTLVEVELTWAKAPGQAEGRATLVVRDDNPEGFKDLTHAYTLFAESEKKGEAEKRGRFNLGEKLVLALCHTASIQTTKGTILFNGDGREELSDATESGTVFTGDIGMTEKEFKEALAAAQTLIPPEGIKTLVNGAPLAERTAVAAFEAKLRTELADEDGYLRPTTRKTTVRVYDPLPDEAPALYELGIPVVETGDRWHVDVGQKVPLNSDRDNVPPGYLRDVRTEVLNHTHAMLSKEEASAKWVDRALEDERVEASAVTKVLDDRYGKKRVIADPNDREAEKIAVSKGYAVMSGGALSKEAWKQVKAAEAAKPAGLVTPSPNPQEGADKLDLIDPAHLTPEVKRVVAYAEELATQVLGAQITVRVTNSPKWPFAATYGPQLGGKMGQLTLNVGRLGYGFFEKPQRVNELLIHEFAHHYAEQHLSEGFYDACCRVGAALATALATDDEFRKGWGGVTA